MGKNSSISNSKEIPKACLIACVMAAVTLVSAGYFLAAVNALPAPMITGRVSLDEKLRYLRNNKIKNVEIASIGASEGLNNLSTDVMKEIPVMGDKYFNFSIWSLNMSDLSTYWDFLSQFFHPKIMIICMSPYEFRREGNIAFNEKDLKGYLTGKHPLPYYLKYRGMYFINRIMSVGRRRRSTNTFDTLNFDSGGGANIDDSIENVKEKRWNMKFESSFYSGNYKDLDELLSRFKKEGVRVFYVVSPMRSHSFEEDKAREVVAQHWNKVQSILERHGMHFLNMHQILSLDDRFFADAIHLNKTGADLFTKELLKRMDEEHAFEKVNNMAAYKKAPLLLNE